MSDPKKILEFPDVGNKLSAPSKKSLFERQKAEAEAKRLREEAETQAVLADFVKSFDDEETPTGGAGSGYAAGAGSGMGGPRRHFGGLGMGPGGRGSGSGSLGPPPMGPGGFGRGGMGGPGGLGPPMGGRVKRRFEEMSNRGRGRDDRGLLAFDDYEDEGPRRRGNAFGRDEEEDKNREAERAIAKPTLRLANLPPGTSPAVIKALLPPSLTIDNIRILPPAGPMTGNSMERKSSSAIVTLAKDTPANDIDSAVNALKNRYLGFGFNLDISRHISSAALASAPLSSLPGSASSMPFGAKPVNLPQPGRGGPPGQNRNFAPPTSYTPMMPGQNRNVGPIMHVPVTPPTDLQTLKLIHKTIEALLTHGPEFEALLMSRPSVQREEKWAWIWDARSVGGVWYRWRLWEILTGAGEKGSSTAKGKYMPLFEGASAWKAPEKNLVYEFTTKLEQFVDEEDYNSSDEEEDEAKPGMEGIDEGRSYLNPLEKAKLTHLLARLPTSTARLRKGDVARVTAFAIEHAGRGADEIVSMVVDNVGRPFAFTGANPSFKKGENEDSDEEEKEGQEDRSSAQLIGLYVLSDILSSSSTSGVRHAWRYRGLFEAQLKKKKTFEMLGRMEKKLGWGKLKAEKWKRSVGSLLGLWEGWCVFPQASHDAFVESFNNPPATKEEEEQKKREESERNKGKWKAMRERSAAETERAATIQEAEDLDGEAMDDVDGEPMEDVDGEPMEDIDGEPMEDLDGEPMDEDGGGEPMQEDREPTPPAPPAATMSLKERVAAAAAKAHAKAGGESTTGPVRQRPRAVDMFADSDEEEDNA
jgi:U2-associated protein SR140